MASAFGDVGASNRCDAVGVLSPKEGETIVAVADSMEPRKAIDRE